MALFGLFGGNKNETQQSDFFLDFEEAQTLGDTQYMKEAKTIKRTFPKLKGNPGKTIISQVSSGDMRTVGGDTPAAAPAPTSTATSSFAQSTSFSSAASSFTPSSVNPTAPTTTAPAPVAETAPAPTFTPAAEAPAPVVEETKAPEPAPAPTFTPAPVAEKKVDTSMDMFRNMAKNIRR